MQQYLAVSFLQTVNTIEIWNVLHYFITFAAEKELRRERSRSLLLLLHDNRRTN
ncbi:MAG: hypothetical protein ACR2FN_00735 [Chitinophagaceae bacterium]